MSRRFIAPFVVCSILLCSLSVAAYGQNDRNTLEQKLQQIRQDMREEQQRLKKVREQREKRQGQLQQADQREQSILVQVENQNERLRKAEQNFQRIRELVQQAKQKLQSVEQGLESTRNQLSGRRTRLKKRLRSIYKGGELMQARMLFNANSVSDLLKRTRYARQLIKHDQSVIDDYQGQLTKLERLKSERESLLERRKSLQNREQSALKRLEQRRKKNEEYLEQIRNNKQLHRQRLEELEQEQQRVKNLVFDLQDRMSDLQSRLQQLTNQFARQKGQLPWPVESCDLLRGFGKWERRGVVHENDGIDIDAREGEQVQAVASGKVMVSRRFRGMGKIVLLVHGDEYVTLYGSLVKVNVEAGDNVAKGDAVGRAGQTSGMDQPRLYFQVFEGRQVLDPTNWISCNSS